MKTLCKAKYLIVIFSFLITQNVFSQTSNLKDFLPLNIGNTWVYYFNGALFGPFTGLDKYKIISKYNFNGKTYFKFIHSRVGLSGNINYAPESRLFSDTAAIRIDSVSGNIYRNSECNSSQEMLVDSLKANLYDTSYTCYPLHGDTIVCADTTSIIYFGNLRISRAFTMDGFEGNNDQIYAENLGLTNFNYAQMGMSCWAILKGCIINGVVYGDTAMVGIELISNHVPNKFTLSQNYPNPFNPITKIIFKIPHSKGAGRMMTQLIIYDILGREIATLVNEQLSSGTYEVEWDGSNYPSGVYFYKLVVSGAEPLITVGFTETRKMALVK
jgi:hypothetical protein